MDTRDQASRPQASTAKVFAIELTDRNQLLLDMVPQKHTGTEKPQVSQGPLGDIPQCQVCAPVLVCRPPSDDVPASLSHFTTEFCYNVIRTLPPSRSFPLGHQVFFFCVCPSSSTLPPLTPFFLGLFSQQHGHLAFAAHAAHGRRPIGHGHVCVTVVQSQHLWWGPAAFPHFLTGRSGCGGGPRDEEGVPPRVHV